MSTYDEAAELSTGISTLEAVYTAAGVANTHFEDIGAETEVVTMRGLFVLKLQML